MPLDLFYISIQSNISRRPNLSGITQLWLNQRQVQGMPNRDVRKQGTCSFEQATCKKLVCFRSDGVDVLVPRECTSFDDAKIFSFWDTRQGCAINWAGCGGTYMYKRTWQAFIALLLLSSRWIAWTITQVKLIALQEQQVHLCGSYRRF